MCLAIPGRIVEITNEDACAREGVVSYEGVKRSVNLTFTPEAVAGDFVLVHVGFAISRIDEAAARRTFEALRQMDSLEEAERTP